jgi:hypothetical protein
MQNHIWKSRHKVKFPLAFVGWAFVGMLLPPLGLAQYDPPEGDPPQVQTASNGSRSFCSITKLAPTDHVGRSTTPHSTLASFVQAESAYRVEVKLYNLDSLELVYTSQRVQDQTGIVTFTPELPPDAPTLKTNQRYGWEVAVACDPENHAYHQVFVAEVEVVEPPQSVTESLALVDTSIEQAEIYARAGYWYDAFREALATPDISKRNQKTVALLQDLAALEDLSRGEVLQDIAKQFEIGSALGVQTGE